MGVLGDNTGKDGASRPSAWPVPAPLGVSRSLQASVPGPVHVPSRRGTCFASRLSPCCRGLPVGSPSPSLPHPCLGTGPWVREREGCRSHGDGVRTLIQARLSVQTEPWKSQAGSWHPPPETRASCPVSASWENPQGHLGASQDCDREEPRPQRASLQDLILQRGGCVWALSSMGP